MSDPASTSPTTSEPPRRRLDAGTVGYFAGGAGRRVDAAREPRGLRALDVPAARARRRRRGLDRDDGARHAASRCRSSSRRSRYQRLLDPEGEVRDGARAAAAAGTVMCVSTLTTRDPRRDRRPPAPGRAGSSSTSSSDRGGTRDHVAEARAAGYSRARAHRRHAAARRAASATCGSASRCRADLPLPYVRAAIGDARMTLAEQFAADRRSLTWRDLEWIAARGAAAGRPQGHPHRRGRASSRSSTAPPAVVVSNHGGRQLDGVAADARRAAGGRRGGRRPLRGATSTAASGAAPTSLKALALGARAVLVGPRADLRARRRRRGRACAHVLELLRDEIELGARAARLHVAGTRSTRSHVERPSPMIWQTEPRPRCTR